MRPECSGKAVFKIRASGERFTIKPDELEWQDEAEEGGDMGLRRHHYAEVELDDSGHTVVWNLWEYPIGAQEDFETDFNKAALELIQDFEYQLVHEPENDDTEEP